MMLVTATPCAHWFAVLNTVPPSRAAVAFQMAAAGMSLESDPQEAGGSGLGTKSVQVAVGGIHTGATVAAVPACGV